MKFAFAAAAILAALAASAQAQQALSGADIQKALKDKRVALSCVDGTSGSGRYTMQRNSGTIKGSYAVPPASPVADSGQVRAQGDSLCLKFAKLNAGQERCFAVSQAGPGRFDFSFAGISACQVSVR